MTKILARKKPVEVYAVQWLGTPESLENVLQFMGLDVVIDPNTAANFNTMYDRVMESGLSIETLEGTMTASLNDYIIQGVNGEYYPCKPEIFDKTYDVVLPNVVI
ncbi:hypothetical protein HYQ09_gp040 [Acinetobacter phage vB_AbaM_Konradin]|uniref:Uncharacterized protein n=1 Tax=Acinetobacter phage vB_AbaM_Konradin TaxID=2666257 RepID=A0A650EUY1_9CAUD|nr:hypothetical protein HYQ09_gp040 [Acinetobacter phage vB_AbaM_Konradin]QGT53804.1 hypothetical protein Konradin_041 [Acinetobacter phage vB_AbaM_Konradin]